MAGIFTVPPLVPLFSTVRLLALIVPARVIAPLALLVKPAPVSSRIVVLPVPESSVTPGAMEITALPASRKASTTPEASGLLPVSVRLPLSVIILALTRRLRPACKVKSPPLPPGLLAIIGLLTVMSLLACSTTAVPAFKVRVKKSLVIVTVAPCPRANVSKLGLGSTKPTDT